MTTIYSKRFLFLSGPLTEQYVVPAGQLAVIRCITAVQMTPITGHYYVAIESSSYRIWNQTLAAPVRAADPGYAQIVHMRVVVHAGEPIIAFAEQQIVVSVSGYLFTS